VQVLTTIQNVGGSGFNSQTSIASEATLAALLQAVKGSSGLNNSQEDSNNNAGGGAVNALKGTAAALAAPMAGAVKGVGRLAKELAYGNARLGDFAEAIFDGSNAMVDLTRYLDSNIDNLRELSSAGASFNNSLVDMLDASVKSGMRLGQFQQFVSNSTESLAAFGGTVTSGAKSFGKFSKDFRSGTGKRLFEMGLTVNDINDSLLSYAEIERRRTGENIRNDAVTRQNALEYSKTVEELTKVTGLQRDQIEESLQKQVQEARVRNMQSKLSGQELRNFQKNLAFIDEKIGGEMALGIRDIMDGVAQTEPGIAIQNQLGASFVDFAQRMGRGEVTHDEFLKRMASSGKTLDARSKKYAAEQLTAMESAGGAVGAIATLYNETYKLLDMQALNADKAGDEGEQTDKVTASLMNFDESITALRTQAIDVITTTLTKDNGLIKSFENLGDTASDKFSPAIENISTQLGNMMTDFGSLSLSIIGPEGGAVSVIDRLTAALDNIPDNLTNIFGDGGLLGEAITNIKTEFNGVGTAIAGAIAIEAKNIFGNIFGGFAGSDLSEDSVTNLVKKFKDDPTKLSSEERSDLVRTLLSESRQKEGGLAGFLDTVSKQTGLSALSDLLNYDGQLGIDNDQLSNIISIAGRNIGTLKATGKTTEPADITAKLHKGERVLNPQEAAAYNSQTGAGGTIQQLNTTMNQAVSLLQTIAMYQGQTAKSVAGIGTDYYRGINT
jgi:hypothetical protein